MEKKVINDIIKDLTLEIRSRQAPILKKIGKLLKQQQEFTFAQFNGRFGGKNNVYTDVVRNEFIDFEDFYAQWLAGLMNQFEQDMESQRKKYNGKCYPENEKYNNLRLLKYPDIEQFVMLFLERNFYNKIEERTRHKPDENLWSIWFGEKLTYGLLIAPVFRRGEWTNDKSEIRKVNYAYWTVGHAVTEGFVDAENNKLYKFKDVTDLTNFYKDILSRLSTSQYEKKIYLKYISYINKSSSPLEEPLLIPELRYAGLKKKHEHRLDFTVLNIHSKELVGFEISPASSHMSVSKLKEKQVQVNRELSLKWGKEMKKRNDYFAEFGITTITFTDETLLDIDKCFDKIIVQLKKRRDDKPSIKKQQLRLKKIAI